MEKLLYIDACIRDDLSRTKKIATPIVNKLKEKYDVETLCINDLDLYIIKKEEIVKKNNGNIPEYICKLANKVKNADRIVIAAPFWDMSIPAALKVFFELVSIIDITFKSDDKTCYGNCKCQKVLYITTRGMNIKTNDKLDQATSYLNALFYLWGIDNLIVLARENMDYISESEVNNKINDAIVEGLKIAEDF